jgi:rhamnulokinase
MGIVTEKMIISEAAFTNNFANEGGVGWKNRFLKNIMGLWLIQECQRQFRVQGINTTFEEIDIEAEEVVPFRSIINPDDPIFFQPGNMIRKIQDKCRETNQSIPETPAEINRCIKESLALAYRKTLIQIEQVVELKIPLINIIGGGAQSDLLNQFAASAMGIPVLAGPYEAAAIGNLCAQFISSGELSGWNDARTVIRNSFTLKEYLPVKKNEWDDAYGRFLNLIAG